MISLRAPKIFIRWPSQAELEFLLGLSRSSRSTFSPSLTAQTYRTEAEVLMGQSSCVIRSRVARVLVFERFINTNLENFAVIVDREFNMRCSRINRGFRGGKLKPNGASASSPGLPLRLPWEK